MFSYSAFILFINLVDLPSGCNMCHQRIFYKISDKLVEKFSILFVKQPVKITRAGPSRAVPYFDLAKQLFATTIHLVLKFFTIYFF